MVAEPGFGRSHARNTPKQFAKIIGDTCLFAETIKRVADRNIYAAPIIVAGIEHKFFILDILEQLNIYDFELMLEPFGRNTAPAAIISALSESQPDILHLVMPCDHLIADSKAFDDVIIQASSAAFDNIILFGMQPEYPETGYGYIIPGNKINSHIYKTKVFYEKPEKQIADNLISQGSLWNSGIFLYNPSIMLKEAKIFAENLA
ncbi:MAG: sugar phosphate nucleotidyltransferase [Pseudomonadota bacterium]